MLNKSISYSTLLLSLLFALPTPVLGFWENKKTTTDKVEQFIKKNPKKLMAIGGTTLFFTLLWLKWGARKMVKKTKRIGFSAAYGYTVWPIPLFADDDKLTGQGVYYPNVLKACAILGFCSQAIGTYVVTKKLWNTYKSKK